MTATACWPRGAAAALAVTLSVTLPVAGHAQAAGDDRAVEEIVESLRPGQHIRLLAPGISILDGTVVSASRDLLSVLEQAQQWEVTPSLVESLAVRERATRRALLTGAAFGATFGFVMGFFFDKLTCNTPGECDSSLVLGAGVAGTLVGAGGGAALGYRSIQWKQWYP